MNSIRKIIAVCTALIIAVATGFWWGSNRQQLEQSVETENARQEARKILYYRNPMGHPDRSPVPKKDSMGMDYIPVYQDEASPPDSTALQISTEKIQKLGVRTETVVFRQLHRTVQALATIQANEKLLYTVTPKFEGWVQRLYVNTTGQQIKKGEVLMDVYSPELITAQHDYLIAAKGIHWTRDSDQEVHARMQRLSENALQRLYNWDISKMDLHRLQRQKEATSYLPLRSPVDGIVLRKNTVEGKRFMPGEVLYEIADLSHVWLLAEVFEQDLQRVSVGQTAIIAVGAYPDKKFSGTVTFIYPTVTPDTRTTKVRIELNNDDMLLKPEMYARIEFSTPHDQPDVLAIPNSAILHADTGQMVFVARGAGRFEPRTITLGLKAEEYTEVLLGLDAGETIVTRANFLIDAESNLRAALPGFNPSTVTSQIETKTQATTRANVKHHASGIIKSIDWTNTAVTIAHDPVESLHWPAMTMNFKVVDAAMLHAVKPAQRIDFGLTQEPSGGYVIEHFYATDTNRVVNGHDRR